MKKKALIIPASIKNHVLPSFFLADMLSEDYEVTYAVVLLPNRVTIEE